jgi:hypothetical protein
MKTLKILAISALVITIAGYLTSCKKIQEDTLIKGLWRLDAYYIDSSANTQSTENVMEVILPHFADGGGCCDYKVDFQEDDIVFAYYQTYDTFNYVVIGTWELREFNKIYVNLDRYVDGEFDIDKTSNKHYTLSSEANHIAYFDNFVPLLDTSRVRIKITRL